MTVFASPAMITTLLQDVVVLKDGTEVIPTLVIVVKTLPGPS